MLRESLIIFVFAVPRAGTRLRPGVEAYKAQGALFLPPEARFSFLLSLPEGSNLGRALTAAMREIESKNPELTDVLPRTYQSIPDDVLVELLRALKPLKIAGDAFGHVYEYFMGNFAKDTMQKGGEFYTTTVCPTPTGKECSMTRSSGHTSGFLRDTRGATWTLGTSKRANCKFDRAFLRCRRWDKNIEKHWKGLQAAAVPPNHNPLSQLAFRSPSGPTNTIADFNKFIGLVPVSVRRKVSLSCRVDDPVSKRLL